MRMHANSPGANARARSSSAGAPEWCGAPDAARLAREACASMGANASAPPAPEAPASARCPSSAAANGSSTSRNTALSTPAAAACSALRNVQMASTSKPTNSTSGRSCAHATVYSPLPQPRSSTTCANGSARLAPPGAQSAHCPAHAAASFTAYASHAAKRRSYENPLCNREAALRILQSFPSRKAALQAKRRQGRHIIRRNAYARVRVSSSTFAMNSSVANGCVSLERSRTEMAPSSASFSPTMIMYGTRSMLRASRIL